MVVVDGGVHQVNLPHRSGGTDSASILSALNLVHHLKQSNRWKIVRTQCQGHGCTSTKYNYFSCTSLEVAANAIWLSLVTLHTTCETVSQRTQCIYLVVSFSLCSSFGHLPELKHS